MKLNRTLLFQHLSCLAIIFIFVAAFFYPQYQGKKVTQSDVIQGKMAYGEISEFEKQTKKDYNWNNSMFGGMPYGLLVGGRDANLVSHLKGPLSLFTKFPSNNFLRTALLCYLALILLGCSPWLALFGSLFCAFNINNIILLAAGHNSKYAVTSFFPLLFAGVILNFTRQSLSWKVFGAVLFGLGVSLSIASNHVQMLYYNLIALGFWSLVVVLYDIKNIGVERFKSIGLLMLALALGLLSNYSMIKSSQNLADSSMRGKPILEVANQQPSSSTVDGLEYNYAMQWSNGWTDVLSLIIPRAAGGSSSELVPEDSESGALFSLLGANAIDKKYRIPLYYGKLPFTSGPFYLGAIVFFLLILGMFSLPNSWRLGFAVSIFVICLLSLGQNMETLNRFVFEYLPFYNKFRAPNSVFHAAPIFIIFGGVLGFSYWLKNRDINLKKKHLIWSASIAGGFCLLIALLGPSLFELTNPDDARFIGKLPDQFKNKMQIALESDRVKFLRLDAFRSAGLIFAVAAIIWIYLKGYFKNKVILISAIGFIALADILFVSRSYFGPDGWTSKAKYKAYFEERPVDKQLKKLEPRGRQYYRVLDLTIDPWNSAAASVHNNTIGGYSAAKQQRYQDLIDRYLSRGDAKVIGMLNGKYIVSNRGEIQQNPNALGNAWFVKDIVHVNSADEEISSLREMDLSSQASINMNDFPELEDIKAGNGIGSIELVEYEPDRLVYSAKCNSDQIAVFSETWYPNGWSATVDGKTSKLFRVNYLLRALKLNAGEHKIVLTYNQRSPGSLLSLISSLILLLLFVLSCFLLFRATVNAQKTSSSKENAKTKTRKKRKSIAKRKDPKNGAA